MNPQGELIKALRDECQARQLKTVSDPQALAERRSIQIGFDGRGDSREVAIPSLIALLEENRSLFRDRKPRVFLGINPEWEHEILVALV